MIALFHFWNVMRGDAKTYSIWRNKSSLSIPRIESCSGFAEFDFTKTPLQDMIHGSGFNSFRHLAWGSKRGECNLGTMVKQL
jgi:hypothetical protein